MRKCKNNKHIIKQFFYIHYTLIYEHDSTISVIIRLCYKSGALPILKKTTKIVKIVDVPTEIRNMYLPNRI